MTGYDITCQKFTKHIPVEYALDCNFMFYGVKLNILIIVAAQMHHLLSATDPWPCCYMVFRPYR